MSMISADVCGEVSRLHGEIADAYRNSLAKAIRIGEILAGVKAKLNHGEFGPWVASNLPFDQRTAQNYMRVFRERDRLKSETVSHLGEAYRLLASPSKSETVSHLAIIIDGINVLPEPGHALEFQCGHDALYIAPVATGSGEYYFTTLVQIQPDGTYQAEGDARGINVSGLRRRIENSIPRYFLHGERREFECEPTTFNPWLHDSEDEKWAWQLNRHPKEA